MSTTDHAKPRTDFGAVVAFRYRDAGKDTSDPVRIADTLSDLAQPNHDGSRSWTGTIKETLSHLDGISESTLMDVVRSLTSLGLLSRQDGTVTIPALLPVEPEAVQEPTPASGRGPRSSVTASLVTPGPSPRDATDKPSTAQPSTATGKLREVDYRIAVMDAPGLSVGARYTGVAIARHCWRHGELFAGMDTVSEWIGNSPESRKQTGKYVRELVSAGLLAAIGKAGRTTQYRLTVPD